jgi:acyl-CoA thioester hydrolase
MGHVNNAVFFTFFEEGRKKFLSGLCKIDNSGGHRYILAKITCDFYKPVKMTDRISLQLWVSDIGKKSFTMVYKIVDKNDISVVYARGNSVQVFFDYDKNITVPIPNKFFEIITKDTE